MNTVRVNASKSYNIFIGREILAELGHHVLSLGKVKTVCIVSETNVFPLFGQTVEESF